MPTTITEPERTILVSLWDNRHRADSAQVKELEGLVEAAGGTVVGRFSQRRDNIHQGLGKGALTELVDQVAQLDATTVVSDVELSPSVLNHWSRALPNVRVLDRTQVILDIFARRARSREGVLQVELAQLRYLLPRVGAYRVSERSGGGIGTRGPGETPLEMDRRRLRSRIQRLSSALANVAEERQQRRHRRAAQELPLIALVGYTNVGKSTLFRRLTGNATGAIANALFVTLDPTVRRIEVPGFGPVLLTDTVGFVDRLPHTLVNAFHATLDEVRDADILVVVNDGGDPLRDRQLMATEAVLKEVDASEIPQILVYNQSDRVDSAERHAPGLWISALTGEGIEELWEALRRQLLTGRQAIPIFVPWDHKETWQALYQSATIVRRVDVENGSWLAITCSPQHSHLFAGYESEHGTPPW